MYCRLGNYYSLCLQFIFRSYIWFWSGRHFGRKYLLIQNYYISYLFTYYKIVIIKIIFIKERKFSFFQIYFPWQCHCFVGDAQRQFVELNDMYKKMGSMFEDMSDYFCFDKKQYNMNDFFGDIKTFQDNYKVLSFISNIFLFQLR